MLTLRRVFCLSPGEVRHLLDTLNVDAGWQAVSACESVLGTSSYLSSGSAAYRLAAANTNPILSSRYGWLYDRLLAVLEPVLRAAWDVPLRYAEACGLPGFVSLSDGDARERWAGAHCDYNVFYSIGWDPPIVPDSDRCASFTLPICLPMAGTGLLYWDGVSRDQIALAAARSGQSLSAVGEAIARKKQPRFVSYRAGELVVHSGQVLHDIPSWQRTVGTTEVRLTLQGHAVVHGDAWQIFW